jgi:hypothetical protein
VLADTVRHDGRHGRVRAEPVLDESDDLGADWAGWIESGSGAHVDGAHTWTRSSIAHPSGVDADDVPITARHAPEHIAEQIDEPRAQDRTGWFGQLADIAHLRVPRTPAAASWGMPARRMARSARTFRNALTTQTTCRPRDARRVNEQ